MSKAKLSDGVSVLVSGPLLTERNEEERWKVWRLYKCPACGHEIYTDNEKEKALLNMENLQPVIKLPLESTGYSFAFLQQSANAEGGEICLPEEHLSELDSKFNDFIEHEQQAMEERIREYAQRQRQLFSEFQQRALVERNILLYKLPERRQPPASKQEVDHKPETTAPAAMSAPAKSFVSVSSMRLIKDQIAVSASGEREISKSIESDPSKKESLSNKPMPAIQSEEHGQSSTQKLNEGTHSQPMVNSMSSINSGSIKARPGGFVKAKKQRSQEPALFDFDEESLGSEQSDNEIDEPDHEADETIAEPVRDEVKQQAFPYASSLPVMISNPFLNKPKKEKDTKEWQKNEKEKFVEPHVLSAEKNNELTVLMDRPSASWRPATTWAGNI